MSKPREWLIAEAIIDILLDFDCEPSEAENLLKDVWSDYPEKWLARAEARWEAAQQSLMESGGPDDSHYRQQMKNAGRGHLLR